MLSLGCFQLKSQFIFDRTLNTRFSTHYWIQFSFCIWWLLLVNFLYCRSIFVCSFELKSRIVFGPNAMTNTHTHTHTEHTAPINKNSRHTWTQWHGAFLFDSSNFTLTQLFVCRSLVWIHRSAFHTSCSIAFYFVRSLLCCCLLLIFLANLKIFTKLTSQFQNMYAHKKPKCSIKFL